MSRAILRAATIEDEWRRRLWDSDEEIRRLAPIVERTSTCKEYAIEVAGTRIGFCSVYNVTPNEAQLGITIGNKDYWGKGYGAVLMNQLTEFCFNSFGVKRVCLKVLPP